MMAEVNAEMHWYVTSAHLEIASIDRYTDMESLVCVGSECRHLVNVGSECKSDKAFVIEWEGTLTLSSL